MRKAVIYAVCLISAMHTFPATADDICRLMSNVSPGQLYVLSGEKLVALKRFQDNAFERGEINLYYASRGAKTGGAVAIKQLNQGRRTGRSGGDRDVQKVALERPEVRERCRNGIRAAPMKSTISVQQYEGYHSKRRQRSDTLDLFHYSYRPDKAKECRDTNAESSAGRGHYLFTDPGEEPSFLSALSTTIGKVLAPKAQAAPASAGEGVSPPTERYTFLRTMLRRVEANPNGASCAPFPIRPDDSADTTSVTIIELNDVGPANPPPAQVTWTIRWSSR